MIKVNKDLNDIPYSLCPIINNTIYPIGIVFPSGNMRRTAKTTQTRREEIIASGNYPKNDGKYDGRYKYRDIIDKLKLIYNNKCAFCETYCEQLHVEHYRPKSKYYWLAYSWDNLLLACPTCNTNKNNKFEVFNRPVCYFDDTDQNRQNINSLSSQYDIDENPKLINPEVKDALGNADFNRNGQISSSDPYMSYTIEVCKLDRTSLNDRRRKLLDDFKNHISAELLMGNKVNVECEIRRFIRDANNLNNEFLAFRKYAVSHLLYAVIKELIP